MGLRVLDVPGPAAAAVLGMAFVFAAPALAAPETYGFDKEHTEVRFSWDHLGMSRQSGRFHGVEGTVVFDPEKPETSTVDVRIPLSSLATGIAALDDVLLRKPDYLNAEAHPVITFKSTEVIVTTARTANVTGDLTFNGVTKPATLSVVWNFSGEHPLSKVNPTYAGVYGSGFSGRTQILRSEFNITRSIPLISDEIRITIEAELNRK